MLTFLWLTFCSVFVYTESVNPKNKARAVNLALETVIEFDNKDRAYDLRFIDQVQGFLNKVKHVLKKDQNYRRAGKPELKFSDFIKGTLAIINTYEDEDLEYFLTAFNKEARRFNYKGCKFHELVQNTTFRRYVGEKLNELKEIPLEDVRNRIDEILKLWNEGKLGEHNKQLIDLIDSLYEDEATEKIAIVLNELDLYRKHEKQRSSLDLYDTVKKGLRSLFFDHFTNLKAKQRNDVRLKLENAWLQNRKEESHGLFDSYIATDMNKLIETEFSTTTKVINESRTSKEVEELKEFLTTTKVRNKSSASKQGEEVKERRVSNEEPIKRSHHSDESDDETTKESDKTKKSISTSIETEEIKSTKNKNKTTTTTVADETSEETSTTNKKENLDRISLESKETTTTKKKHRKHSKNVLKENIINPTLKTSKEKTARKAKRIKFRSLSKTNKSMDDKDEVSSTVRTKKNKNNEREKIENNVENPEIYPKTKKVKHSKIKKYSISKLNNNINNNTQIEVTNSAYIEPDVTAVTVQQKKNRKSKTKSRHEVSFRNFELSDEDTIDTKMPRSTTDPTLATDDVQESSDYETTKKSRTSPASNEGMSIESFEDYKNNVRKNNDDDVFLEKLESTKQVVPDVVLNRLSQLEKELKAMKSQITVTTTDITVPVTEIAATEKQTSSIVKNQNPLFKTSSISETRNKAFETLTFWKGSSKFVENKNEKKDMTTIINKTTQKHQTKTSPTAKAIDGSSTTADYQVITRNKSLIKYTTEFGTSQKNTAGRVPKTIKFDSPNLRATAFDSDKPKNKAISAKKIFISVETQSEFPNATNTFLVPFNLNNTNIKYEIEVATNAESTENFSKHILKADDNKINEIDNSKALHQENRRAILLQDEKNDINDYFDPDDLLDGGDFLVTNRK